jgi:hypothetical protein
MKANLFKCSLVAAAFAAPALADGPIVYEQAPNLAVSNYGYFSDGAPNQFYLQRIADNFTLGSNQAVNGVNWWGCSEGFYFPNYVHQVAFNVRIYADVAGLPGGAPLVDQTYATAGTIKANLGPGVLGNIEYYQGVKFNPINLNAGQKYWVSVGSINNPTSGDAFAWQFSSHVSDGLAAKLGYTSEGVAWSFFQTANDCSFQIQAVPEPTSLALLALGGLLGFRRR